MIDIIYLLIGVAYTFFIISFITRSEILMVFTGLFMMIISVYTFVNGLDIFNNQNLLSLMFSSVNFGIGAYLGARGGLELLESSGI